MARDDDPNLLGLISNIKGAASENGWACNEVDIGNGNIMLMLAKGERVIFRRPSLYTNLALTRVEQAAQASLDFKIWTLADGADILETLV